MPFWLVFVAALAWGLQFAFLMPALALLLVEIYGATDAQVGTVLMVFNTAALVASTVIPVLADRKRNYVAPLVIAAVLTLALVGSLAATSSLWVATAALVSFGAPAGIGFVMLFALMRHSGETNDRIMQARATVSFAWVGGPPLATFVMDRFGPRAAFILIAIVAVVNLVTALAMRAHARTAAAAALTADPGTTADTAQGDPAGGRPVPWGLVVTVMIVFALLQATNNAGVSVMTLYVTETLREPLLWAGIVLGVAALVEIPGLLALGKLEGRFTYRRIMLAGCVAGIAYYAVMALAGGIWPAILAQVLNASFYACVAGLGLTLFQSMIDRPGLATALFSNAGRVGAILSGALIVAGTSTPFGYAGVYLLSAIITALAVPVVAASFGRVPAPAPPRV